VGIDRLNLSISKSSCNLAYGQKSIPIPSDNQFHGPFKLI